MNMETKFLSCELLGKRGVLWSRLAADIEAIQMHLVTTTCREGDMAAGIEECCTVVLTMVRVIWRELRKVRVEAETSYGLETHAVKVGQYLWGNLAGPQSDGKLSKDPVTTAPGGVPSNYYVYVRTQGTTGGGVGV